jgi:hypothetical protein
VRDDIADDLKHKMMSLVTVIVVAVLLQGPAEKNG